MTRTPGPAVATLDVAVAAAPFSDSWLERARAEFSALPHGAAPPVNVLLEIADAPAGTADRVLLSMDLDTGRIDFSRATGDSRAAMTYRLGHADAVTLVLGDGRARVALSETGRLGLSGVFLFEFFLDRLLQQDPSGAVARLRAYSDLPATVYAPAGDLAACPLPTGPRVPAEVASALPRTARAVREQLGTTSPGVQLYVSLGGTPLTDFGAGDARPGVPMDADSIPIWYCCSKTVAAVVAGRLWERGLLDLFAPVVDHVPWFGGEGRERIRWVDILTHTTPVRLGADPLHGIMSAPRRVRRAALARMAVPEGPAGQAINYAAWWGWFLLAEAIEAVTGLSFAEVVRRDVLEPCGMDRTKVVLDDADYTRRAHELPLIHVSGGDLAPQPTWWFSTRDSATRLIPGLNMRGPMSDLGRFFEMLARGGRGRNGDVLSPVTVHALTGRHRVGLPPDPLGNADWALGFRVESRHLGDECCAFGRSASLRSFGHYGLWTTVAFADPDRDLVVALHFNGKTTQETHQRRVLDVLDAIYADVEGP